MFGREKLWGSWMNQWGPAPLPALHDADISDRSVPITLARRRDAKTRIGTAGYRTAVSGGAR